MARIADQIFQCRARQQRHYEIRFTLTVLFEFTNVKDLDDIGMAYGGEYVTLFIEEIESSRFGDVANRLESHMAPDSEVVRPVDDPHAAFPQNLLDFVTPCEP